MIKHSFSCFKYYLNITGEQAIEVYNTFCFDEKEVDDLKVLMNKFELSLPRWHTIDDAVRSRLLRETELDLQKTVDICRASEESYECH